MGMVVSSVVSGGPPVLEDLSTPYVVLQERQTKEKEKQRAMVRSQKKKMKMRENSADR